jgi:AcrR family transcriptional regulator
MFLWYECMRHLCKERGVGIRAATENRIATRNRAATGNRAALIEAAIVCLRDRGFGRTTARDLAQTAGVSLGAIGYHFGSTEALLNEAIAESSRRWIRSFRESLAASGRDASANFAAQADILFETFAAYRELLIGFVEAFAHAQRSPVARAQLAGYYDEFRREIAGALPSGGESGVNTESVASLLIAIVDGLMIQWLLAPERCPDRETLRRAAAALATLD